MAGYLLVVDPTRPATFASAKKLHSLVEETLGPKPFVLVMNKADLKSDWELDDDIYKELSSAAVQTIETSAKEDFGVDEVFHSIASTFVQAA